MLTTLSPLHSSITATVEQVNDYASHSRAANTVKAYQADWRHYSDWCAAQDVVALPATPQTVALYITSLAGHGVKTSTIQRRMSAISQAHQMAGHESPTKSEAVRTVMKGIRRVHGTAQVGKAPVMTEDIRAMVNSLPDTLIGVRDRALLLVGFAGAFRRSELVSLDVTDVELTRDGVVITIRRSKTDQEGRGVRSVSPTGPSRSHARFGRSRRGWRRQESLKALSSGLSTAMDSFSRGVCLTKR